MIGWGVVLAVLGIIQIVVGMRDERKRTLRGVGVFTLLGGLAMITVSAALTFTSQTRYVTYSNFGFSFEHPEGLSVVEQGSLSEVADETSGIVGVVNNQLLPVSGADGPQYLEVAVLEWEWEWRGQTADPQEAFDNEFKGLEEAVGDNGELLRHLYLDARASGDRVIAQAYTVDGGGLPRSGVKGVWYCDLNQTLYNFELQRLGTDTFKWVLSEGMKEYERYLKSFVCSATPIARTPAREVARRPVSATPAPVRPAPRPKPTPTPFAICMTAAENGATQVPSSAIAPPSIPLSYSRDLKKYGVTWFNPESVPLTEARVPGLIREPDYRTGTPLYGLLRFGVGGEAATIPVVVEKLADDGQYVVYLDLNRNCDLTDDPVYMAPEGVQIEGPIEFVLDYRAGSRPYAIQIYTATVTTGPVVRSFKALLYYRASLNEGMANLEGRARPLAVLDDNANGLFNELDKDTLIIDIDGDGLADGSIGSIERVAPMDQPFFIDGTPYRVAEVAENGVSIRIEPARQGTVTDQ